MDPTLREGLSGLPYGILTLIIITEIYCIMSGISKDKHSTSQQAQLERNE